MRYFLLGLLFCAITGTAQIVTMNEIPPPASERKPYDPSENIFNISVNADLGALTGKELYFSQMSPGNQPDDRYLFFDEKVITAGHDAPNWYRKSLPFSLVQDKTYKIVQVEDMYTGSNHLFCFTLTGPDGKSYYWYVHDFDVAPYNVSATSVASAVYFVDNLDYIRHKYLNNDVYLSHDARGYTPGRNKIGPVFDEAWHCSDVLFSFYSSDRFASPHLRLVNDKNDSLLVPVGPYTMHGADLYMRYFWSKEQQMAYNSRLVEAAAKKAADSVAYAKELAIRRAALVKRYGKVNGTLISENKVVEGMTKKMCEESWGQPDSKTVSTNPKLKVELWSYPTYNAMLTFSNNILKSIIRY